MDDISYIDPTSAPDRTRGRTAVLAMLLVALVAGLVACGASDDGSGKALPDARLTDLRTEEAADWGAEGKPLVVNFWASWCTPCKKEMPAFEEVAQDLDGKVVIVGVTDTLDLDGSREAAEKAGVTYPLLVDEDQDLQSDLGIAGLPATIFVDEDGTIVGRHLGALTRDELTREIEERYGIQA
jgi:thiol-disulfide isomerase/thioredoxin